MARARFVGELEKEAEAHLTLARLLRKERSPAKRAVLRRILRTNHPIQRKIAEIEALDAEAEREEAPERPQYVARRVVEPLKMPVSKLKLLIKAPRVQESLFRYLFREYAKILHFGYTTHTVSPTFLLPAVRPDRRFLQSFADGLKRAATELHELIRQALQAGWRTVEKREYNLLVILSRLCEEIVATNFSVLSYRDRRLIDRLSTIEVLFLILRYQPEDTELVIYTLGRVLSLEPSGGGALADRAEDLSRRILMSDFALPSLYNYLLILNMIKWRRWLTLPELLAPNIGDLINDVDFACADDVRTEIETYVGGLRETLTTLDRRRTELKKIRTYLPLDSGGGPHIARLQDFYQESQFAREEAWSFGGDKENVVLFVPRLLRLVDATFSPLLAGKVVLASGKRVAIFAAPLFGTELQKLRNVRERVEKLAFDLHTLTYKRYLSIKRDGKGGIRIEGAIISYLEDAQAVLLGIAGQMRELLAAPRSPAPAGVEPHPLASIGSGGIVLPHEGEAIRSSSSLNGKSVVEALAELTTICYLTVSYLYEQDLASQSEEEVALSARFDSTLATLRRVADSTLYDETVTQLLGTQ